MPSLPRMWGTSGSGPSVTSSGRPSGRARGAEESSPEVGFPRRWAGLRFPGGFGAGLACARCIVDLVVPRGPAPAGGSVWGGGRTTSPSRPCAVARPPGARLSRAESLQDGRVGKEASRPGRRRPRAREVRRALFPSLRAARGGKPATPLGLQHCPCLRRAALPGASAGRAGSRFRPPRPPRRARGGATAARAPSGRRGARLNAAGRAAPEPARLVARGVLSAAARGGSRDGAGRGSLPIAGRCGKRGAVRTFTGASAFRSVASGLQAGRFSPGVIPGTLEASLRAPLPWKSFAVTFPNEGCVTSRELGACFFQGGF